MAAMRAAKRDMIIITFVASAIAAAAGYFAYDAKNTHKELKQAQLH